MLRNRVIQIERGIFATPGVVAPVNDCSFASAVAGAHHENRSVIAAPGLVRREMVEVNALKRNLFISEKPTHPFFHLYVPDVDVYVFNLYKVTDQFGINWWHGLVLLWKADP